MGDRVVSGLELVVPPQEAKVKMQNIEMIEVNI